MELLPSQDQSVEAQRYIWELGRRVWGEWGTLQWTKNYKLSEKFSA